MAEIVITEFMDDAVASALADRREVLYDPGLVDRPADLVAAAGACSALIVRSRTRVDAALLDRCPKLRVVGRLGGVWIGSIWPPARNAAWWSARPAAPTPSRWPST